MNLVTLTMHSPSHASAMFVAKVMERNNEITGSMEVGGMRSEGERGKNERGGEPLLSSSTANSESAFSNQKVRLVAITGRGYHSYSPIASKLRSAIMGDEES